MLRRQILPLMALLISVSSPLLAQSPTAPSAEAGTSPALRTYEVKKGDTLWGISKKFIEDPYYWPDLWANNPDIQNPHFIYPGQKLRIYSGPITVVGVVDEEPAPPPVPLVLPEPPPPPPAAAVEAPQPPAVMISVPSGVSFVGEEADRSKGRIFDFSDSRYFAGSGDTVFVRVPTEAKIAVGDQLQIIKSRAEIIHPVTKKRLGFQVDQLGILEITALGKDLHTAIIRKSFREIERGAWLSPRPAVNSEIALRRAVSDVSGLVVAAAIQKEFHGPNEAIFVDLGERQGLEVGNLLTVTRPLATTNLAEVKNKSDRGLTYPDELIAYALVVEINPDTATAIILKSLGPTAVGDQVKAQTGQQDH